MGIAKNQASGSGPFNGGRPITRATWPVGVTPGGETSEEFLEKLFYPALSPMASISIVGGNQREFGASNSVGLNYVVTKKTYGIATITVAGSNITPGSTIDGNADADGSQQSGTLGSIATQNVDTPFSMSVVDNQGGSGNALVTLFWRHKRFWFVHSNDYTDAGAFPSLNTILNAISSSGYELSTNRQQTRSFSPSDQYIYFIWPVSFGGTVDNFTVNGLANNAWVVRDFTYENQFGYSASFRLFRSQYKLSASYSSVVS
jgi:hypothetical protein